MWWCEVPDKHRRPVVVLSRNAAIPKLRRVIAAPCSTVIRNLVTEVRLEPEEDPCAASMRRAVGLNVQCSGREPHSPPR